MRAAAAVLVLLVAGCATPGAGPGPGDGEARPAAAPPPALEAPACGAPQDPALDAQGWYQRGNRLAEDEQLDAARAAYVRALELDPTLARARHNLGLVHLQLGWKALLQARRELPPVDRAAAATMDYLGCLMQVFRGRPAAPQCGPPPVEEDHP